MSEYWKSTPKYWCKHCSTYIRDTKLERTNHEATAKHQGNLKRFLRDLHRGHDQEQREKERAKREIERLNGVVGSSSSSPPSPSNQASGAGIKAGRIPGPAQTSATNTQRQKQWEQLAEMGIDIPTELRPDMALAGEWTVTSTKVIDDVPKTEDSDTKPEKPDAIATGVRKRAKPEGEVEGEERREEEAAIKGLFKKPRKWGRDTRQAPEDDAELEALLNGSLTKTPKTEERPDPAKKEEPEADVISSIKEESDEVPALSGIAKVEAAGDAETTSIEKEESADGETPAVVFKKRKPKNIRQK
ncbi:hypothetical protein F4779DRAFT_95045 [Xylariaceae sp. FL0662B]|nr:hypothetical protein F4779DRAFT_95045 [Xylariaceae sp. FL0662B]